MEPASLFWPPATNPVRARVVAEPVREILHVGEDGGEADRPVTTVDVDAPGSSKRSLPWPSGTSRRVATDEWTRHSASSSGAATRCSLSAARYGRLGAGGLGAYISSGLATNDLQVVMKGAVPVTLLALLFHLLFVFLKKWTSYSQRFSFEK